MRLPYPDSDLSEGSSYLPLMYLQKIKRPGQNYVVKGVILDDLPIIILAYMSLGTDLLTSILGAVILTFSFWCLYDYGYYENDRVAAKYEKDPTLSDEYYRDLTIIKWWHPWLWAILFSILGIVTLKGNEIRIDLLLSNNGFQSARSMSLYFLLWLGFLLVSRALFWVYNHVNKRTRIWLYPLLQVSRYSGLMVLLPINLIGIAAILGQVFARSATYTIYRYATSTDWPKLQDWFLRWVIFAIIMILVACAQSSLEMLLNWRTLAISAWWLFRSRKQIAEVVGSVEPVWNG